MSLEDYPSIELPLPDGTRLKAVAIDDENFPAINLYWDRNTDEENGEIFCLSEVRLFDSNSMQEFIESWNLFDEDLHQAMYAMKKYLKNQEDQYVAQNRLGNTLCGKWSM